MEGSAQPAVAGNNHIETGLQITSCLYHHSQARVRFFGRATSQCFFGRGFWKGLTREQPPLFQAFCLFAKLQHDSSCPVFAKVDAHLVSAVVVYALSIQSQHGGGFPNEGVVGRE
jgi:hypothetical protein